MYFVRCDELQTSKIPNSSLFKGNCFIFDMANKNFSFLTTVGLNCKYLS